MADVRVGRGEVVHAFGPALEPVLEVEPGTVVTFETRDCFDGQIRGEADLVTEIDFSRINAATGPVAVKRRSSPAIRWSPRSSPCGPPRPASRS